MLSAVLSLAFMSPIHWPESRVVPPLTDAISPVTAMVSGSMRSDPYAPLCQTPIPPEYGEDRGQWLRRCYVYRHWTRDGDPEFVEMFYLDQTGNSRWDAFDPEASDGRRTYSFLLESRSRQGSYFEIWDRPTNYNSHILLSMIYVFPRRNLAAIQLRPDGTTQVTLPTGENVLFDSAKRNILGGALREGKFVDRSAVAANRQFADVNYVGTGISVRVNARGADPRLWNARAENYAVISQGDKSCRVHPGKLWNQDPRSRVEFLYETDEKFSEFLTGAIDVITGEPCGIQLSVDHAN